jgi:hypothetical protein
MQQNYFPKIPKSLAFVNFIKKVNQLSFMVILLL